MKTYCAPLVTDLFALHCKSESMNLADVNDASDEKTNALSSSQIR